jgi:hypothetical protein
MSAGEAARPRFKHQSIRVREGFKQTQTPN